jgi:hypothetical protein
MKYRTFWAMLAMVGFCLCFSGCTPPKVIVPDDDGLLPEYIATTDDWPSYGELVARYNRNIAALDQLWSRSKVSVTWRDDKGKKRSVSGEGNVIIVRPRKVALTVGKLGTPGLWAGCDTQSYWLFDLQEDVAFVGCHEYAGHDCSYSFPLPVLPAHVPYLLGVMLLDPTLVPDDPAVERLRGYALIEPPGLGMRMMLVPQSGRVVRIDLLDEMGGSAVVCRLSAYQTVEVAEASVGQVPQMPSKADIYVVHGDTKMTVSLSHLSDGRADDSFRPSVFKLDKLLKLHKPDEVVFLDKDCGE